MSARSRYLTRSDRRALRRLGMTTVPLCDVPHSGLSCDHEDERPYGESDFCACSRHASPSSHSPKFMRAMRLRSLPLQRSSVSGWWCRWGWVRGVHIRRGRVSVGPGREGREAHSRRGGRLLRPFPSATLFHPLLRPLFSYSEGSRGVADGKGRSRRGRGRARGYRRAWDRRPTRLFRPIGPVRLAVDAGGPVGGRPGGSRRRPARIFRPGSGPPFLVRKASMMLRGPTRSRSLYS